MRGIGITFELYPSKNSSNASAAEYDTNKYWILPIDWVFDFTIGCFLPYIEIFAPRKLFFCNSVLYLYFKIDKQDRQLMF